MILKHFPYIIDSPHLSSGYDTHRHDQENAADLEKETGVIGRKLKVLKNHIQVVTCFDASNQGRKVTRI